MIAPYFQSDDMTLYHGDALSVLHELPEESVHCVVTSPPYWGLRVYSGEQEQIWGGDEGCEHAWAQYIPGDSRGGSGTPNGKHNRGEKYGRDSARGRFCEKCGAWKGALGLEPRPFCGEILIGGAGCGQCWICHMVQIMCEVRRVLRKDGTVFLNLGDSYASGKGTCSNPRGRVGSDKSLESPKRDLGIYPLDRGNKSSLAVSGLKPKDLCLLPHRLAIALQSDGWWVRQDIVWSKNSAMPESTKDRCTRAHEYIFLLTKSARYFFDNEAIKEPCKDSSIKRLSQSTFAEQAGGEKDYAHSTNSNGSARQAPENLAEKSNAPRFGGNKAEGYGTRIHSGNVWEPRRGHADDTAYLMANKRDVWEISSEPFPAAHFAVFPSAIPEICIKAATSEYGSCANCGTPWRRNTQIAYDAEHPRYGEWLMAQGQLTTKFKGRRAQNHRGAGGELIRYYREVWNRTGSPRKTVTWSPGCLCNADIVAATVLDPFCGSGTTCAVAYALGRKSIGVDLSADYLNLAIQSRLRPLLAQARLPLR